MHVVIAIVHHSLWCEFASTFNVLTLWGCNVSCCRIILRRVSDTLGLRFLHSTLPLVLMGIHNLVASAILEWGNSFYVFFVHVIYLCYKSSSTVCVSIPIQGWHLSTETWSIRVRSLHMSFGLTNAPAYFMSMMNNNNAILHAYMAGGKLYGYNFAKSPFYPTSKE